MIIKRDGAHYKLVCPECSKDKIGESGFGGDWVYCSGHCMRHIRIGDCIEVEVTSPEEIAELSQEAY